MPTNKRVPKWPCLAKIYKLWWRGECTDVYVGSTRRLLLCERMKGHRDSAKRGSTSLVHSAIRDQPVFEYDLLETVHCENFDESRTVERRWAEILDANLNMVRPIVTKEEMKVDTTATSKAYDAIPGNKEKRKERDKVYYAIPGNKEKCKEKYKVYRAIPGNKEKRKEKEKVYSAKPKTKEKRKAAGKVYYAKNVREERFSCDACAYYAPSQSKLTRHKKSQRHKKRLSIITH